MHELAICKNIMEIINAEAKEKNFSEVTEINLIVGEFSGLIPSCIIEFFPIASKGTAAENAKITIKEQKGEIICRDCGYSGTVGIIRSSCPNCGGTGIKLVRGREFFVESLAVI